MISDVLDFDLLDINLNLIKDFGSLSSEDVLVGLLDFGLFAEKMPPCFVSKDLSSFIDRSLFAEVNPSSFTEDDEKCSKEVVKIKIYSFIRSLFTKADQSSLTKANENQLKEILGKKIHSFIRYEALRDINIPRHLGIPHPESYAVQALAISKHWSEISSSCGLPNPQFSRVHVRHVGGGRIFEMNYEGDEKYQHQEEKIQWMAKAKFVVKADISACFPSIYTHSIPWALHGLDASKSNTSLHMLSGNLLDRSTQINRDGQTNGLLIGPHASNIISEIILTQVDKDLCDKKYSTFNRHIDDYEFYASSYEEAENFLRDLGLNLRKYEMSLNEKKTRILPLPRPSEENWIQELNRFNFPDDIIRFSTIRSFLDLALEGAQAAGTSATLNYALKMLSADFHKKPRPLNQRAKKLYVQEAINLVLLYPYLASIIDEFVFERYSYVGIKDKIRDFTALLIDLGLERLYPDAICHALYYALKYEVAVDKDKENTLLEVIKLDDCLTNVLLLEYAKKNSFQKVEKKIKERASKLKGCARREVDKQWLLVYQVWTENELKGNRQNFLAELKKNGFQFIALPT